MGHRVDAAPATDHLGLVGVIVIEDEQVQAHPVQLHRNGVDVVVLALVLKLQGDEVAVQGNGRPVKAVFQLPCLFVIGDVIVHSQEEDSGVGAGGEAGRHAVDQVDLAGILRLDLGPEGAAAGGGGGGGAAAAAAASGAGGGGGAAAATAAARGLLFGRFVPEERGRPTPWIW